MKHAGLPWEFGLMEAHRALRENRLRDQVELRVDGGLLTGKDIVTAAILVPRVSSSASCCWWPRAA